MAVSPRTNINLAGSFANIQRGLGNIAELERTKPSVTGMAAKKIGDVFQTIMMQELKVQFDDRNKVKLTDKVIEDFENSLGQPLRPDVKASLKPFMGKMIDPSFLAKVGEKTHEQGVTEGWLETVPEADRPLAEAATKEFQKGQVKQAFETPEEQGEIIFIDKTTGKEIRREPNPKGPTKVISVGGKAEKAQTPQNVAQKTFNDASRTGFYGETYFETFRSLAGTLGLEESEIPTEDDPVPDGFMEKIFSFQGTEDKAGGAEGEVGLEGLTIPNVPENQKWFNGLSEEEKAEVIKKYGKKQTPSSGS